MLERTGASHVVVSSDSFLREVADKALATLSNNGKHVAEISMPTFEELFAEYSEPNSPYAATVVLPTSFDMNGAAGIFHSSGELRSIRVMGEG